MCNQNRSKEEYLMLREEILHLDNLANNTINFFYAFISAYIAFALTQEDTLFLLLSYIGIIPPYLIVLNKMSFLCKIGAYLNVFHEGENFNWERRNIQFKDNYESSVVRVVSWHVPFVFVSLAVSSLLLHRTNWESISGYDIFKVAICLCLFMFLFCKVLKNRNISSELYINKWKKIKTDEMGRERFKFCVNSKI